MPLKALLIISIILLGGCRKDVVCPDPEPIYVEVPVYMDCGQPPRRDAVELRTLAWQVGEDGRFSLSAEGYEDLGYNISEIWSGVEQLLAEIGFYEECQKRNTQSISLLPQD